METEPKDGRSNFEKFLLAEYDHISQAHFATVASISSFFQYYVLIISLPVSAAVVLGRLDAWVQHRQLVKAALANNSLTIATVSTVVFCALLAVAGYVINLRADALLYARTINGIRKYFFNYSGLSLENEFRFRVLPRSTAFPPYLEPCYFAFVVATFAFLNSLVLAIGWWIHVKLHAEPIEIVWVVFIIGVLLHFALYRVVAHHREYAYLHGHIVGVDIDGVLGRHRDQFCRILKQLRGIEIDPDQIARIPVRESPGLGVQEEDEIAVFHHPAYWTGMPVDEDALSVLKRLKDTFHYDVFVFSWRDWPVWKRVPGEQGRRLKKQWRQAECEMLTDQELNLGLMRRMKWLWENLLYRTTIARITRNWLWMHGLEYDSLVIERGNVDMPCQWGKVHNRFVLAGKKKMRIFVEDEVAKARRLSDICDVVFLIKHPYNQHLLKDLPNNVLPVDGWNEILDFVRDSL